jgi:ADP-L-glycero-D-manno-heptose 6-epimerase
LETLRPLNPYAMSKQMFDMWAKKQNVLKDIVSLKYFNIFGPNEGHKGHMASMIYKMFPKIHRGEPIELFKSNDPRFEDGDQVRDFLYVKDAVAMTAAFLENDACGVFNIGSGQPTTWNQLAKAIFEASGKASNIRYVDMPEEIKGAYQNYTLADMQKFRSQVRYVPKFTLESAVHDYVVNHLIPHKGF